MVSRPLVLLLALSTLTTLFALVPGSSAEMKAPTLTAPPGIDGVVGSTEWGVAESFTYSSPASGTSTVRLGYLAETQQLAMGLVLHDPTERVTAPKDRVDVYVSPRSATDPTTTADMLLTVFRDGAWEFRRGNGSITSGFSSTATSSGTTPSTTTATDWVYAFTRSAASWEVEILVKIGTFNAGSPIYVAVKQTDVDAQGLIPKTVWRPSGAIAAKPTTWELTLLTGRPSPVQFTILPPNMEVAVGGEIIVTLPADSRGGRLTVQVQEPGGSGYIPIGTLDSGAAGANVFRFAPLKEGSYQVQGIWAGDGTYGAVTTTPIPVTVAKPTPAGATVLETGSMRAAFALESAGVAGEWAYLNTKVRATDTAGATLALASLTTKNSCKAVPWVGFANLGEGPLIIRFEPPVLRAALALVSPHGPFTANVKAFQSNGALKVEVNGQGSGCSTPMFAALGDVEDDVARIEITYSGGDPHEVVDIMFPHPLISTAPAVTMRVSPSPPHAGGAATLHVSAGYPFGLIRASVAISSAGASVASETCNAAPAQVWIDCPVEFDVPADAKSLTVTVTSTPRVGAATGVTRTLALGEDTMPPAGSLLPRPLLAPPGAAVAVTARAVDGSPMKSIQMTAVDPGGATLNEKTCEGEDLPEPPLCTMGVSPPDEGFAFVTARFEDAVGNVREVGPKPLPVRGPDTDGDGLSDALEAEIGTSPTLGDSDDDGLSDGWEAVGVDRNGDGQAELDLAAMGADPQVRDLFLEVDWAEHEGHSHAIPKGALQLVRNVLSSRGIRLHVDASQGGGPYEPARFDHGHAAHRALIDPARAGIFVHVLSGHLGGPAAGDGWTIYLATGTTAEQSPGRVGAQLLHEIGHLLELGHGGGESAAPGATGVAPRTLMTEDHKPHYLSVINNAYAWGLLVDTIDGTVRVPSFSDLALGNLDENMLGEPAGLTFDVGEFRDSLRAGPTFVLEDQTVTGVRVRYTCPGSGPVRWAVAPGPIDWNCDGSSDDTGVQADINRGGDNTGLSTLVSRTDWDRLSFRGPICPQFSLMLTDAQDPTVGGADHGQAYEPLGLAPCPLRAPAASVLEVVPPASSLQQAESPPGGIEEADGKDNDGDGDKDDGFADDDNDNVANLIDDCPRQRDASQADEDRDGRGDACETVPPIVEGLESTYDLGLVTVQLKWAAIEGAWGYNIYRAGPSGMARLGLNYPSTTGTRYEDQTGSADSTYWVRAVNDLGDQGPPGKVRPVVVDTVGEGGEGGGGNETEEEGVPALAPILATLVTIAVAGVARRREAGGRRK